MHGLQCIHFFSNISFKIYTSILNYYYKLISENILINIEIKHAFIPENIVTNFNFYKFQISKF